MDIHQQEENGHIDLEKFVSRCEYNNNCIQIVEDWIGCRHPEILFCGYKLSLNSNPVIRRNVIVEHMKSIWLIKSAGLEEFEQRAFEFAAMCDSDIRPFIQDMPYIPCNLAQIITKVLFIVLKELKINVPKGNSGREISIPFIPDWISSAISSIYSTVPETMFMEEYRRMQGYIPKRDDPTREHCTVCMILDEKGCRKEAYS